MKDRLTRSNLHDLVRSLGAEPLIEAALLDAPRFALVAERLLDRIWRERVDAASCSLDEADDPAFIYLQRGLSWVPHMRTHASSVIADLERAIEINPAFGPGVRRWLVEAHRIEDR